MASGSGSEVPQWSTPGGQPSGPPSWSSGQPQWRTPVPNPTGGSGGTPRQGGSNHRVRNFVLAGVGVLAALVVIGAINRPSQPISSPFATPTLVTAVSPSRPAATASPTTTPSSPATFPPTPSLAPPTQPPIAPASPTAEPPTPEPPTPQPATPEPVTLESESGRGDKVLRIEPQFLPTVATISNRGQSNFAVVSYIGSDYDDLLVNEIGRYQGMVYIAPGVDNAGNHVERPMAGRAIVHRRRDALGWNVRVDRRG